MSVLFLKQPYIDSRVQKHGERLEGQRQTLLDGGVDTENIDSKFAESTTLKTEVITSDADILEAALTTPSGAGVVGTAVPLTNASSYLIFFTFTAAPEDGKGYWVTKTATDFTVNTSGVQTPAFDWVGVLA